jgi:cobalt/nickel transport system permease protein
LQFGAFSVSFETFASGITELPFGVFVATMQPIHLAIGLVEGIITAAVLVFIYEARPEILWCYQTEEKKKARFTLKKTVLVLAAATLLIGGAVSLFASAYPDGLEWSMQQVAGSTELESEGKLQAVAANIQNITAVLPDYSLKNTESQIGTSISGIVGGILVMGLMIGLCYGIKFFQKNKSKVKSE